jgi:thioester reductase-like protein
LHLPVPIATDCHLPEDIRPGAADPPASCAKVLLTGATGFLGSQLLRELLEQTEVEVTCLVRSTNDACAHQRMFNALARVSPNHLSIRGRVRAVNGDICHSRLGLTETAYDDACKSVDAIYHCAAQVDWAASYKTLRRTNVLPVPELLRLAVTGRHKPFCLVSSAATCYLVPGAGRMTEARTTSARIDRIRLPYARSKWVGERLVCEASRRGLSATIFRPSIILGHSQTGISNQSDIVARMLKACIKMRLAPDIDLVLDYCPVDFVARAIVALSRNPPKCLRSFHLLNPSPVRWPELVLWLNLFGYEIQLVSHARWLDQLAKCIGEPSHPLRPLRGFFLDRLDDVGGLTLFETYERGKATHPCGRQTFDQLSELRVSCPPLTASLIERYVDAMISTDYLPAPAKRHSVRRNVDGFDCKTFEPLIQSALSESSIHVTGVERADCEFRQGITSALAAWKYGANIGLSRYVVTAAISEQASRRFSVIVKAKPFEHELRGAIVTAARLCDDRLAHAFAATPDVPGFSGSAFREAAVYAQADPRFRRHAPFLYGIVPQADSRSVLVLEDLADVDLIDSVDRANAWRPEYVAAAVRGIAEVHAIWYGREPDLEHQPWLGAGHTLRAMVAARELWESLFAFTKNSFSAWAAASLDTLTMHYLETLDTWWPMIEVQRRTLVHNDFNPRNMGFRRTPEGPRLCAFDWELASLGLPQRDLAELLCFVLAPEHVDAAAPRYLELHRTALERQSGHSIDPRTWHGGFGLALRDLLVSRLPMYAIMHRFRRQEYLPRVVATWYALHQWHAGNNVRVSNVEGG